MYGASLFCLKSSSREDSSELLVMEEGRASSLLSPPWTPTLALVWDSMKPVVNGVAEMRMDDSNKRFPREREEQSKEARCLDSFSLQRTTLSRPRHRV